MKRSYPTSLPSAKFDQAAFMQRLEMVCRIKLSELFQAVLEAEVDQALERVRTSGAAITHPRLPRWA